MASSKENSCSPDSSNQATKRSYSDSDTEAYSDDSNGHLKKFKQKKDSDSDDSISEECKNVSRPEESDSSQVSSLSRADSESPIFPMETKIRKNTSEWTATDLPHFRLKFEKCLKVEDVFFKGVSHFGVKKEWSARVCKVGFRSEEDRLKDECFQYAILDILNIDCSNIDEIDLDELLKIKRIIEDAHWIANFVQNSGIKNRICSELSSILKIFIWQLLFMVGRRQNDDFQELSEGMFQELFVNFARIFSLNIVSGPSVPKYPLTVCGKDFVAIPDAILCHPTDSGKGKICAIIEVKRYKQDEDHEQVRHLRSIHKTSSAQHIGSSLKGQHGGQFLCSLPSSVFGNSGMYGFIVQGTNVTFTSFKPEDGYFESLSTGYLHKKGATVEHSKEYNILRKDDRKQLVQTFLDLGKLLKFLTGER